MAEHHQVHKGFEDMAVKVFDMSQNAAETYLGSCNAVKRELLEILCTNRRCDPTTLILDWRSPFDGVVEMAKIQTRVGDWILHVPKVREFVSHLRSMNYAFESNRKWKEFPPTETVPRKKLRVPFENLNVFELAKLPEFNVHAYL